MTKLAQASGIETPTRADLAQIDRKRKKKGSNDDWTHPHDPDARITKMKDGRTHLAHKAGHAVDLETGAIVEVTVQDADDGDAKTSIETLITAAEQIEAVLPEGTACERSSATRGITAISCSSISKPSACGAISQNLIAGAATGRRSLRQPPQSIAIADVFVLRGACGCCDSVANAWSDPSRICETGGMRRVHLRGYENTLKRLLIHTSGFNLALLMRQLIGVGTPRGLQGLLTALVTALLALIESLSDQATRCGWSVRHISPRTRLSIPRLGVAHIGARELAFTTGC